MKMMGRLRVAQTLVHVTRGLGGSQNCWRVELKKEVARQVVFKKEVTRRVDSESGQMTYCDVL